MNNSQKNYLLTAAAAGGVLVSAVAAFGGIGAYCYNQMIKRGDKSFLGDLPGIAEYIENKPSINPVSIESEKEDSYITAFDKIKLHGTVYKNENKTSKWVIAVHGYAADNSSMTSAAYEFITKFGFNVLTPDCRGHGLSGGGYYGMGWHDRRDIISWIDYITKKDPRAEIVLYGVSMGAAAVMMASGDIFSTNVKCIVEDCGYTSAWDEMAWIYKKYYDLEKFPYLDSADAVCRLRAGYSLKQASALYQVKRSHAPILFIHGEEDNFVPYPMVFALYEAARRPKDIYTVPDAGHLMSSVVDPEGYWNKISCFISKYITL